MSIDQFRLSAIHALDSARSIPPAGAATIFAIAYIAGLLGSIAALFVAAALFVGLFAARLQAAELAPARAETSTIVESPQVLIPAAAVHPGPGACGPSIAEAIANGLQIRKIEFSGPAPVKARKVAAPQA